MKNARLLVRIGALVILGVCGLPSTAPAQEKEKPPEVLMRVEPDLTPKALEVLYVRPNTVTTSAIYLRNLSVNVPNNATVNLVQIVAGKPRLLAQAKLNPADKNAALVFVKVKKAPDEKGKDPKDAKDDPEKIDLTGPPWELQLLLESGTTKWLERSFPLRIRSGRDLVSPSCEYDKATRKLTVRVDLKDAFDPKGCPVELVLGPGFKETKKGTFKQILTAPNQPVELFAEDVELLRGASATESRVYLNVNGYDRAVTFKAPLTDSGKLSEETLDSEVVARLRAPAYALPSEKFKIGLELDGLLDPGSDPGNLQLTRSVEVGLDRSGKKDQYQVQSLSGLRQQKIQLSIAPTGELVWHSTVNDWKLEFDTTDVFGPVWFRVRVLDGKKEVDVIRARGVRTGEAATQADRDFPKAQFARVILDGTPPEDVKFVGPKKGEKGKSLILQAKAAARPADRLSPIDKVTFIQGKKPLDGKINPDSILGDGQFNAKSGAWTLEITAPSDKDVMEVSVQFVTGTGKSEWATGKVVLASAAAAGKAGTTIKGMITNEGGLRQPDLAVKLYDDKSKEKATAKTNAKGEFVFEKVAPGTYYVVATKSTPAQLGRTAVEVSEGQEVIDDVAVVLKVR